MPASLTSEVDGNEKELIENFIIEILENRSFSPYPSNQLVWGYYGSFLEGVILVFACPISLKILVVKILMILEEFSHPLHHFLGFLLAGQLPFFFYMMKH